MEASDTGTELQFGDLLRRHRASVNVTQEDLADRTGLTPQAIGLLERGKRRRPHGYTVQKLAETRTRSTTWSWPSPRNPKLPRTCSKSGLLSWSGITTT